MGGASVLLAQVVAERAVHVSGTGAVRKIYKTKKCGPRNCSWKLSLEIFIYLNFFLIKTAKLFSYVQLGTLI